MPRHKQKFLIDIGVGKQVETWLKEQGYDTKAMRDIDPKAEDGMILKAAISESRMVATMDKDFGELVFKSGKLHAGVLILRLEDAKGNEKVEVVKTILAEMAISCTASSAYFSPADCASRVSTSLVGWVGVC